MNKVIAAMVAGMFAVAGASAYAADAVKSEPSAQESGRANDPASPEKMHKDKKKSVKAAGAHEKTAGRAGDPCAAGKGTAQGGDVKCAPEAAGKEPGRSGDAASAEKKK
ncbi:MAG TPA: hypothetical protein VFB54_01885 [Burkholderiales bacterium]|nr:hypothetical protein [Burkholderiales bacterium]